MKAIAIFQQNVYEISAARNKILEGDTTIVPEEIIKTEDYLFCLQDVCRAWVINETEIMMIYSDGDDQRVMFEPDLWEAIDTALKLKDKGFIG